MVQQPLPVQSPGIQGIPIRSVLNEMHIGHFLISVAGRPTAVRVEKNLNADNQSNYNNFDHSAIWRLHTCAHIHCYTLQANRVT